MRPLSFPAGPPHPPRVGVLLSPIPFELVAHPVDTGDRVDTGFP